MNGIAYRHAALRVVGIYCLFGIAWILLSDTLVNRLVSDPGLYHGISLIKGWFYVVFTAFLLYLLISRELVLRQAAEERTCELARLLEDSSQPFAVGYPDGRIGLHNQAFLELVGYSSQELAEQGWKIGLTPNEWQQTEQAALAELDRTGQPAYYEKEYLRKDGSRVPVELFVHRKLHSDDTLHYYYAFVTDISEKKRQEEELRKARIAAEVAAQAKTVFLQTMSHELRTPLNGIAGGIQLLAMEPLSEDARSYLEMSRECTKNLTNLVSDILDMADIESNAIVLTDQPLHLPELFQSLEQLYQYAANKKGLKLEFSIDSAIPESVMADRTRLTQILSCLLSNACKFSQQGTVSVMVTQETRHEGETLLFNVRDQGIGIPEEQRQRIFDLFIQADGSITRSFEGTGLGLTLCKRLVELMGGRIWIDSAPDKGTTVWFTLPVRRESA